MENEKMQISKLSDDELLQVVGGFSLAEKNACKDVFDKYVKFNDVGDSIRGDQAVMGIDMYTDYYKVYIKYSEAGDVLNARLICKQACAVYKEKKQTGRLSAKACKKAEYALGVKAGELGL